MNPRTLGAALTTTALLAGGAALVPAHAGSARPARTDVEITRFFTADTEVTFRGTLDSPRASCVEGRTVVLRLVPDRIKVGTDTVNARGRWSITFDQRDAPPGRYQAAARAVRGCARGADGIEAGEPTPGERGTTWTSTPRAAAPW